MNAARGVTTEELVRALKKRKATLPAEIGTFVILEACEAMQAEGGAAIAPNTLVISDEGIVRIDEAPRCDEARAVQALHTTLTALLVAAGPAPAPALMRLVEEGPRGGVWKLAPMRDDLEASLVPLNRTASRRVLARLVRETGWNERPLLQKQPSFSELDAELSTFLGVEGEPSRAPQVEAPTNARERDRTMDVEVGRDGLEYVDGAAPRTAPKSAATSDKTVVDQTPYPVSTPSGVPSGRLRDLEGLDSLAPTRRGRGTAIGLGLVVLAAVLVGVTLLLRPDALSKLLGDAPPEPEGPAEPKVVRKPAVGGDLVVHVTPERAQVLRFVGRGPVVVPNLPVGVAHEFVAILDGQKPTRAVIPPDGEWESLPEGPRYELAMQLGEATSATSLELGDTMLPQNVGRPSGALGSVRIVTTPRGAKVYQVIGFGPDVKVEDVALDKTEELLVFLPGHAHVARVVSPSDFVDKGGRKVAEIDLTLTPLPKRR